MAPLIQAITVHAVALDPTSDSASVNKHDKHDKAKYYSGRVDPEWTIGSVPNGGYILGLILEACIKYQSTSRHVDVLHVTAHFLRTTYTTAFTVHIETVKVGAGFTNITANLVQEDTVKIMTHVIFGVNDAQPGDGSITLSATSPYARRHPLYTHPSEAVLLPLQRVCNFRDRAKWTKEREILDKNRVDHPNRTNRDTVGGGGLEWGTWFEFNGEEEKITTPSLCFLADVFRNTPVLLPRSERKGLETSWFPTMTMTVEFKNKIPPPSSKHSGRTVGIYSRGTFVTQPQSRHETYCEIWTAPSNIGEGQPNSCWRKDQVCLAISTQMALAVPMEVNDKKGREQSAKL